MQHKNSIEDKGYVDFLSRLLDPLTNFLRPHSDILDYGSGPEPVLKEIMQLKGYDVYIYDPFFAPEMPEGQFDAVTTTEVLEHFFSPKKEIDAIISHIKPRGFWGIETLRYSDEIDMPNWHYLRDPTHVGFFSDKTFSWLERNIRIQKSV
ncbi:MAG: class I SAM-dependent methyltransferase [Candidatus Campbellbacteria bacterium]|nr:class I SAM-dependent methyltransferase [Candidatus Campbellbacteria bacterium]